MSADPAVVMAGCSAASEVAPQLGSDNSPVGYGSLRAVGRHWVKCYAEGAFELTTVHMYRPW